MEMGKLVLGEPQAASVSTSIPRNVNQGAVPSILSGLTARPDRRTPA